ncbi:hypothetical protein MBLNU13_g10185t1 [Cladosporium sp. NU13]
MALRGLIKRVQPGPKHKTPIRPETEDEEDSSSEYGNRPTSNEPETPFADLQLVYTSCRDAVLRLESCSSHSKEDVQPWLKIIDENLAGIDKLRKEEGHAPRQGATQETVLPRPGAGIDRANDDRKVMNQEVRRLRQLCSGVFLEVERDPDLVTRKCRLGQSRGETYDDYIKGTLKGGYTVYVEAHNRLHEQQRTSADEQKEVNPKPSKKKKKKGRSSRKKGQ